MTEPGGSSTTEPTIGRGLVLLLAVTCGVLVANLYYAQPLLDTIARSFDIEEGTAGVLVTQDEMPSPGMKNSANNADRRRSASLVMS